MAYDKKRVLIGNIYSVVVENDFIRYFQFISRDIEQLNSDVIRVFKKRYSSKDSIDSESIVSDEVDFFAHTTVKAGIQQGHWSYFGQSKNIGLLENVQFFCADKYPINLAESFWIWKINKESTIIDSISKIPNGCYLGLVAPPEGIYERILTGSYGGCFSGL